MSSGPELLNHKNELIELGKEMVQKCRSRKGYMWTGKFIRMILVALTQIYPLECRNADPERWNSEGGISTSPLNIFLNGLMY